MRTPDGIILSCSSLELSKQERDFFKKTYPLGFVLFRRNYSDKDQLKMLIADLKEVTLNKNLLIFVDQEGGKVQRFDGEGFTKFPPQKIFGEIYKKNKKKSLELAYKSSFLMGMELKSIGVDVTFSPVCDIFFPDGNEVIGSRSFSENPIAVLDLSREFCKGFNDSNIYPVLKHFPGHGRSKFDTHFKKSIVKNTFEEIKKTDLVPFKLLKNEKMVMLAHIIYHCHKVYLQENHHYALQERYKFLGPYIRREFLYQSHILVFLLHFCPISQCKLNFLFPHSIYMMNY